MNHARLNHARAVAPALGRRTVIALLPANLFAASHALAATKVPQQQADYKATPRGPARCDKCVQFLPPAACKLVAGQISPAGSCDFFAPK
jgi:hypothetical protein